MKHLSLIVSFPLIHIFMHVTKTSLVSEANKDPYDSPAESESDLFACEFSFLNFTLEYFVQLKACNSTLSSTKLTKLPR